MNIVGFGDSFIMDVPEYDSQYPHVYMNLVGKHFGVKTESRGLAGSGPWNMFYDFMNYDKHVDIAIIAWSEIFRLYHPRVQPLNTYNTLHSPITAVSPFKEVYEAARDAYKYLLDHDQKNWEMQALMCMFDEAITKKYPNTKFIQLSCFSRYGEDKWWGQLYDNINPDQIEYFHDFKNSVEVRPCLMYLSKKHEYPFDITHEIRQNHLSLKMHKLVADAIIDGIENYVPGRKVNIHVD
jgi:hypothetical protein